ncbi:MAG TPA: helix-turn-helix domain-containing protein [Mucilaginibacter sp.]|jgi:DNA-binding HxlR family transcriptional regulator
MTEMKDDGEIQKTQSLALRDALELLSGKWKFCIIQNLLSKREMRFKDLQDTIKGISPKVLTNELHQLEENQLITRTVNDTKPVTVTYSPTEYAKETNPVINALLDFGTKHRKKIKQR